MGRWCEWEDIYNYKDDGWEEGVYKAGNWDRNFNKYLWVKMD